MKGEGGLNAVAVKEASELAAAVIVIVFHGAAWLMENCGEPVALRVEGLIF